MLCKICKKEFIPNKYRPNQVVCSQTECQKIRQIQNEKKWRLKNPDYFRSLDKEGAWQEKRRRYTNLWRVRHKNYLKEYAQNHKQERREYMREYMQKRRKRASVNRNKS